MLDDGSDPTHVIESLGAARLDDQAALQSMIETILADNPVEVARYQAGEEKLLQFFLGQVMRVSRGNADPALTSKILRSLLK
jgi:aspartyl-tRNA(Asn)/glutamyl-tRNA(Gln) amidotransferase subunit B